MLSLVTGGLTVLIELALLVVLARAPGDPDRVLSIQLVMLLLPYMPLVCLAAILGAMLQAHRRFGPWAAAPILLNLCIIAAAAPYFVVPDADARAWAYLIGAATVLSGVLQVVWSVWALRGRAHWTRTWSPARTAALDMLRRMGPVLIGLGTLQVNSLLDTLIAMWPNWVGPTIAGRPYPLDEASNSVLFYAQRLYQFPLGVFGVAVATVAFPALARAADDDHAFAAVLRRGARLSLFITLPATIGLALVRTDLVAVLYSGPGGGFSDAGVARAGAVLLGYTGAIWAYSLNQVLTRAFYARGDTTTPMRVAIVMVALNLVLNLTLIWPLREAGLAWSTAMAAILQCVVLCVLARRRLVDHPVIDRATIASVARSLALSLVMGAAVAGLFALLPADRTWGERAAAVTGACVLGAGVYGVGSLLTRAPELGWLLRRSRV
ncbi:MAG: lipid II flippase MurJ [Phycisphaerales bacterium]